MVPLLPSLKKLPSPEVAPQPMFGPRPRRVGIVCDFAEEGWPSMDLVAELLGRAVGGHGNGRFQPALLRPKLRTRFTRDPETGRTPANADRYLGRYVDYPRWLRKRRDGFDLFHVADHSYAHLVHALPPERTVVTCHDLDAFRSLLEPEAEPRPFWFRVTMWRVMTGLAKAAHVFCDSEAVRDQILAHGFVPAERLTVAPLPVPPEFRPEPPNDAVEAADALLAGPASDAHPEILHVGSTVARKRIDRLLRAFAEVRRRHPGARLVRVGGAMTEEQSELATSLGVRDAIHELPTIPRDVLAAVYARASVVLQPSEREGFGLPLVEAMACGTAVVASDLPVFREVGGGAATYVSGDDAGAWADAVDAILRGRADAGARANRRDAVLAHARRYSLAAYAGTVLGVYRTILRMPADEGDGA